MIEQTAKYVGYAVLGIGSFLAFGFFSMLVVCWLLGRILEKNPRLARGYAILDDFYSLMTRMPERPALESKLGPDDHIAGSGI